MAEQQAAGERWRDIPGWPGYQAAYGGAVRSVDRTLSDGREAGGLVLTLRHNRKGYLAVSVCRDGKSSTKPVHTLVALAWHGPRPKGKSVRHLDGDKDNCAAWNLRYGTQAQQERDKRRAGARAKRVTRKDGSETGEEQGIRTAAYRARGVRTART